MFFQGLVSKCFKMKCSLIGLLYYGSHLWFCALRWLFMGCLALQFRALRSSLHSMHEIYQKSSASRLCFSKNLMKKRTKKKKLIKAAATSANLDAYSAGKRSDGALVIKAWCMKTHILFTENRSQQT